MARSWTTPGPGLEILISVRERRGLVILVLFPKRRNEAEAKDEPACLTFTLKANNRGLEPEREETRKHGRARLSSSPSVRPFSVSDPLGGHRLQCPRFHQANPTAHTFCRECGTKPVDGVKRAPTASDRNFLPGH